MSTGLAMPSRPRAVRVIGSLASPPLGDAAMLTRDLQSFVCQQPAKALAVLDDWLLEAGEPGQHAMACTGGNGKGSDRAS